MSEAFVAVSGWSCGSWVQERFDGAAFVHGLVALGELADG